MNVRGDGDILEIREIAPTRAPPHAPQLLGGLCRGRNVVRMNGLAVQLSGELKQHLGHIAAGLEPVRARTVIPLLVPLQFQLQPQHLDAELLGLLPAFLRESLLFCCAELLLFGALCLAVTLGDEQSHHRLQRLTVPRKRG